MISQFRMKYKKDRRKISYPLMSISKNWENYSTTWGPPLTPIINPKSILIIVILGIRQVNKLKLTVQNHQNYRNSIQYTKTVHKPSLNHIYRTDKQPKDLTDTQLWIRRWYDSNYSSISCFKHKNLTKNINNLPKILFLSLKQKKNHSRFKNFSPPHKDITEPITNNNNY